MNILNSYHFIFVSRISDTLGPIGIYIHYIHICCFYMELGFHFRIPEILGPYGIIKFLILEESNQM